jgi:nucleoside phosphorylase/tetratricopeptide (TPR) repeat protein
VKSEPQSDRTDPALLGKFLCDDGRELSCALVEVGAGEVTAGLGAAAAVARFNPQHVLFVGVAGGRKDVTLGDVVMASKVHYYESGKAEDSEFLARPDSPSTPHPILSIARNLQRQFSPLDFGVHVGAIASGEKVVAGTGSHEAAVMRQHYGDSLAVEMEGAAFYKTMGRTGISSYALVRGISDLLDGKANADADGWQRVAAAHAATVAAQLVQRMTLPDPHETGERSLPTPLDIKPVIDLHIPGPSPNEVYALVAEPQSRLSLAIASSRLPLSLVMDLDSETDRRGLLETVRTAHASPMLVHFGSPASPPEISRAATSWISVRGIDSEVTAELSVWKRKHRRNLREFLAEFGARLGGRRINVLIGADSAEWSDWTNALLDDLCAEFGDQVNSVAYGSGGSQAEVDIAIPCTPDEISIALSKFADSMPQQGRPTVPGEHGPMTLDADDYAWIQEDLDVVTLGTSDGLYSEAETLDFLRGGEISWSALSGNADVLRTEYPAWKRVLEGVLKNRRTLRMNLFHAPGAGGSTMGRRTLFDLHENYPCVVLRRYRFAETSRRIEMLSRKSGMAVFCLIDNVRLSESQVNDLMAELHASSTSAVVVHVARRYSIPSALSTSTYLAGRLDDFEADHFLNSFADMVPEKATVLRTVHGYPDDRRNPFFFGLAAFDEEFRGLDSYVADRLVDVPTTELKLLSYCAIAHYYGQSGIPEYALGRLLGLPISKVGALARALRPEVRGLLWRSADGDWRTTHQLVARQILTHLGGGEAIWRRNLTEWGKDFAEFCLRRVPLDTDLVRLAEGVFIERGSQELLGNESGGQKMFSRLIEDVPSLEGAVNLLAFVADLEPEEAHFAAHVARFYAFKLRKYTSAREYAMRATDLDPNDHVLHHVLGMVHRSRVYDAIGRRESLDILEPWVKDAADEFAKARQLAPSGEEYAFISEIQLRVCIIDYAVRGSGTIATYLASSPHPIVVESIALAEDLLGRVRYLGDSRNPSGYERTNRAQLTALYGDYSRALQLFNALLDKPRYDHVAVRRQLVWTYLARAERDWRKLDQKSVDRIIDLLDDNLHQDDYSGSSDLSVGS